MLVKILRIKLTINGSSELITNEKGDCLFLQCRSSQNFACHREMLPVCNSVSLLFYSITPVLHYCRFSFGSGEWRDGPETCPASPCVLLFFFFSPSKRLQNLPSKEAQEVLSDASGRWFLFNASVSTIVVVEKTDLPTHLSGLPFVNVPTTLQDVVRQLEDAGEVGGQCWMCVTCYSSHMFFISRVMPMFRLEWKIHLGPKVHIEVGHHQMSGDRSEVKPEPNKPLVFVLDNKADDETLRHRKFKIDVQFPMCLEVLTSFTNNFGSNSLYANQGKPRRRKRRKERILPRSILLEAT